MTLAQLTTLLTSAGAFIGALTAAWHAWQTRKTVVQAQTPAPAQSPVARPSSGGSQP